MNHRYLLVCAGAALLTVGAPSVARADAVTSVHDLRITGGRFFPVNEGEFNPFQAEVCDILITDAQWLFEGEVDFTTPSGVPNGLPRVSDRVLFINLPPPIGFGLRAHIIFASDDEFGNLPPFFNDNFPPNPDRTIFRDETDPLQNPFSFDLPMTTDDFGEVLMNAFLFSDASDTTPFPQLSDGVVLMVVPGPAPSVLAACGLVAALRRRRR